MQKVKGIMKTMITKRGTMLRKMDNNSTKKVKVITTMGKSSSSKSKSRSTSTEKNKRTMDSNSTKMQEKKDNMNSKRKTATKMKMKLLIVVITNSSSNSVSTSSNNSTRLKTRRRKCYRDSTRHKPSDYWLPTCFIYTNTINTRLIDKLDSLALNVAVVSGGLRDCNYLNAPYILSKQSPLTPHHASLG